jgi:lipopolysaccharide transport system ATP-binding protein
MVAIRADGLGKRYWIGSGRPAYLTFRDVLAERVRSPLARWRGPQREAVWALRDVSFEVAAGSVTGIVGANGAGKSTLLKVLSRITRPTTGRAWLRGRIASLLEVGTGFHPELTGRHNVFLNGAILGMTRREILRNFDAIVAFADVQRFIDTPVKFYSTGMYLRLAFAVAAHLRSDILAVDEVLAVGDVLFQRKCLGKMAEVAHDGRTVLLVSHNLSTLQAMCDAVLWIHQGEVVGRGTPADVIPAFIDRLRGSRDADATSDLRGAYRPNRTEPALTEGFLNGRPLAAEHLMKVGDDLEVEIVVTLGEPRRQCFAAIHIEDEFGVRVWSLHSRWHVPRFDLGPGEHRLRCRVSRPPLAPGRYSLGLELVGGQEQIDATDRVATLQMLATDAFGTGEMPKRGDGYLLTPAAWTVTSVCPAGRGDAIGP